MHKTNAWTLGHNPSVFAVDHSALPFGTAGRSNFRVPVEAVYIIYLLIACTIKKKNIDHIC